jgi:precorrin-6B methylase 2
MSEQTNQPSPQLLFDTMTAYQRTGVLKAAIELGIFTAIGKGNETPKTIAGECDVAERGARMLCDYLVVIGFLSKEDGRYRLTQDSAVFLDKRSPAYMGGAIEFLLSPMLTDAFNDIAGAVRKGGTVLPDEGSVAPEHPVWVKFARAMGPMTGMAAQQIVGLTGAESAPGLRVLDIAAGHGMFGITFAQKNPNAEVTALDWPQVLEVAKDNARAAGVIDRFKTIEGSAFDAEFGTGYDIILITNFLHHFDAQGCETLLRKVHAALADGGRAVTLEFVPNEDRVSPPNSAMFSVVMLSSTPRGDAYTLAELRSMFENAGFAQSEMHDLPGGIQQVVISQK